jgi:hypothetical protein
MLARDGIGPRLLGYGYVWAAVVSLWHAMLQTLPDDTENCCWGSYTRCCHNPTVLQDLLLL